MGVWTCKYNGVTKSVTEWGMSNLRLKEANQADCFATFDVAGEDAFDGAEFFAFDAILEFFLDGVRVFMGRVAKTPRRARVSGEFQSYAILGPNYDLEDTIFRQLFGTVGNGQFTPVVWLNNGLWTRAQIEQVLAWAARATADAGPGLSVAAGTIGVDGWLPKRQAESETCMGVIRDQLKMNPDAAQWWDFTGLVPRFNVGRWADLEAVTVVLPGDVVEPELTEREDLRVEAVQVLYRQLSVADGQEVYTFTSRVWPEGADANQRGAISVLFDLAGLELQRVRANIEVERCGAADADPQGFFAKFDPIFTQVDPRFPVVWEDNLVILDEDGGAVSLAELPNYLLPDSEPLNPWLDDVHGVTGRKVRITRSAKLAFEVGPVSADGSVIWTEQFRWYSFSVEVTLTNAVSQEYVATSSQSDAEAIPEGLERYLYETLRVLHVEGTVPLWGDECMTHIRVGKVLNLASQSGRFANMRALIQAVEHDVDQGTTTVQVGPPGHLRLPDLLNWVRALTYRRTWQNPSVQETGEPSGDAEVRMGAATVRNSSSVVTDQDKLVLRVAGTEGGVILDVADTKGMLLKVREIPVCYKNSSGTVVKGFIRGVFSDFYTASKG
jgi:hypothetical protein